jgi:hypothetical protein
MSNCRGIARTDTSHCGRARAIGLDSQWAKYRLCLVDIDWVFPSQLLELGDD